MDTNNLEVIKEEAEGFELAEVKHVDIQFFSKKSSKLYQLLYGSGVQVSVKGQNKDYVYELEEEIYVLDVSVETDGYASYDYSQYEFVDSYGNVNKSKAKIDDDVFHFQVNGFVKKFSFKPDKRYYKETKILQVTFWGYTKSELHDVCDAIYNFDEYKNKAVEILSVLKNKVSDAESKESEIKDKIASLNNSVEDIKVNLKGYIKEEDEFKNKRDAVKKELELLKEQESSLAAKLEQSEDMLDKKRHEQKNLNKEIAEKTIKLKSLKEDINLFPSEISSFVAQGARSISRYTLLSLLPIFVILAVTLALFFNAADLTVLYKIDGGVSVWTVFLTRLPYVVIAATIVHTCYRIAKVFISEILKINQQRLNLSKISIIATDVSTASAEGLNLTDDELYQRRVQLKMELLREHMKEYINEDYKYNFKKSDVNKETKIDSSSKTEEAETN